MRPAFADPATQRRLQRLVAVTYPRGPQTVVQLLPDVADAIGGAPAILAALEQLAIETGHAQR